MQEHPVPQQISAYQFRLVGDMTLKQFFQLAGGALVALLFYATNLPGIVKWPIMIFFGLLGAALAFLPFEDRPLSAWIFAFFRAIYLPTEFSWQAKRERVFFQEEAPVPAENIIAPQGQAALENYLQTPATPKPAFFSVLEEAESNFLSKVTTLLGTAPTVATPPAASLPTTPPPPQPTASVPSPTSTIFSVPVTHRVKVGGSPGRPKIVVEEKPISPPQPTQTAPVSPTLATAPLATGSTAQFSPDAAPPIPPTLPNTVVGQIMDTEGKIVEGAILDVKDASGRPVRALRSNKLGHFVVITPLANGNYQIVTEKDGLVFDPVDFQAQGALIPPMAIKARARTEGSPAQSIAQP